MIDWRELERQFTVGYLASYHPKPYPIPFTTETGPALGMCLPNPTYHVLKSKPKGDCWHCLGLFTSKTDVQWGECSWEYLGDLFDEHKSRMIVLQREIEMRKSYNCYVGYYAARVHPRP